MRFFVGRLLPCWRNHQMAHSNAESRFVEQGRRESGGEIRSQLIRTQLGRSIVAGWPERQRIAAIGPLVAEIECEFVAAVEIVVNLGVDLLAVGFCVGAGANGERAGTVPAACPLMNCRIETL